MKKHILFLCVFIVIAGVIEKSIAGHKTKNYQSDLSKIEIGKVIILDGVYFESEKLKLTESSEIILENVYKYLYSNPTAEIEIRGHSDNIGDENRNKRVSENRAFAVKMWLVKKGIQSERIQVSGFGSTNPIAPNSTPEGRLQNRRIELIRTK